MSLGVEQEGGANSTCRAQYRERLLRIYTVHAPEKLDAVDSVLFAFGGRENEMIARAVQKYGPEPSDELYSLALKASTTNMPADASAPTTTEELRSADSNSSAAAATTLASGGPTAPDAPRSPSERLMWLFMTYCPDKMLLFDDILFAYRSNQEQMIEDFVAEFGPEPEVDSRKNRLRRYYEYYCPEKLASIDRILMAYAADPEEKLYEDLKRKYGEEPSIYCAGTAAADNAALAAATASQPALLQRDATHEFTRKRLSAFYQYYCPQMLTLVDHILATYTMHPGGVRQLFSMLEGKYGLEPGKLVPADSDAGNEGASSWASDRLSLYSEAVGGLQPSSGSSETSSPVANTFNEAQRLQASDVAPEIEALVDAGDMAAVADRLYRMVLFYDPSRLPDLYATMPLLSITDAAQQLVSWILYFGQEPTDAELMDVHRLLASRELGQAVQRTRRHVCDDEKRRKETKSAHPQSSAAFSDQEVRGSALIDNEASPLSCSQADDAELSDDGSDAAEGTSAALLSAMSTIHLRGLSVFPFAVYLHRGVESKQERHSGWESVKDSSQVGMAQRVDAFIDSLYSTSFSSADVTSSHGGNTKFLATQLVEQLAQLHAVSRVASLDEPRSEPIGGSWQARPSLERIWRTEPVLNSIIIEHGATSEAATCAEGSDQQCMSDAVAFLFQAFAPKSREVISFLTTQMVADQFTEHFDEEQRREEELWFALNASHDNTNEESCEQRDHHVTHSLRQCILHVLCPPCHEGWPAWPLSSTSETDVDPALAALKNFIENTLHVEALALKYLASVYLIESLERRYRAAPAPEAAHIDISADNDDIHSDSFDEDALSIGAAEALGRQRICVQLHRELQNIRWGEQYVHFIFAEKTLREGLAAEEHFQRSTHQLEWSRAQFFFGMAESNPWLQHLRSADVSPCTLQARQWDAHQQLICQIDRQWSVFVQPVYAANVGDTRVQHAREKLALQSRVVTIATSKGKQASPTRKSPSPKKKQSAALAAAWKQLMQSDCSQAVPMVVSQDLSLEKRHERLERFRHRKAALQSAKAPTSDPSESPSRRLFAQTSLTHSTTPKLRSEVRAAPVMHDVFSPARFEATLRSGSKQKTSTTPLTKAPVLCAYKSPRSVIAVQRRLRSTSPLAGAAKCSTAKRGLFSAFSHFTHGKTIAATTESSVTFSAPSAADAEAQVACNVVRTTSNEAQVPEPEAAGSCGPQSEVGDSEPQ